VDRISKLQGMAHRPGVYDCGHCRDQFTVTVGTVFESSKISLDKWLFAVALMASSKKGVSSKQIERMLGVTYKTAWFMTHRIREAVKQPGGLMGGGSAPIEADATYVGGKERNKHRSKRDTSHVGGIGKTMVFSLVERGGKVRSTATIPSVSAKNLKPYIRQQLNPKTRLMTDGDRPLRALAPLVASHETVNHEAGEYVRGDVHTNTVEGYFSILKRGIIGTFHSVSPQHLQRYCTEFDFRYNHREMRVKGVDGKMVKVGFNDAERTIELLKGISNKRLTYRRTNAAA
jgi:hypothetical protein